MGFEQQRFETLIQRIHEQEDDWQSQRDAIETLRTTSLDAPDIGMLVDFIENRQEPLSLRIGSVQILRYHCPWQRLDLIHDDKVHTIPRRLAGLITDPEEDRVLREAMVHALGWQYLTELNLWDALLADPDVYLRRETLFELLNNPHRETVNRIVEHLEAETDPVVMSSIPWGLARHPHFFETALNILTRARGNIYLETIALICETNLLAATRALLKADIKYFDVRETLIQRLFIQMDDSRISHLLDLMQEGRHPFATRVLREVEADVVVDVITRLDQTVQQQKDEDWTVEAAKLILHYWDRFTSLRDEIRGLLDNWRRQCPRVIQLAMGRNIYWQD